MKRKPPRCTAGGGGEAIGLHNKIVSGIRRYLTDTDRLLWFFYLVASVYGCLIIFGVTYSTGQYYPRNIIVQTVATAGGILSAIILSKFDYLELAKLWKLYVPAALGLNLLTFFIGTSRPGADDRAWIQLPFGTIQPSEFLKIAFILSFAYHLYKVSDAIGDLKSILLLGCHAAIPVGMVHLQGDDGTALVFLVIAFFMITIAGLPSRYLIFAILAAVIALPLLFWGVMNYDQRMRILVLFDRTLDPQGVGYQQNMSEISIGSGQMWGQGLSLGHYETLPEIQNDFIFAFIGETLGFVGCLMVLLILGLICIRIIMVSYRSKDELGSLICIGVCAMILAQTVINIGMCLRLLPVIGITLPFFSSGGSSALSLYLALGLVLSVYSHRRTSLFLDS